MTDTEEKALALVNEARLDKGRIPYSVVNWPKREESETHEALCRAIERLEATEARHAAELREQAERFSEALVAIRYKTVPQRCHDAFDELAAPFILPAPDPLAAAEKLISTLRADERDGYAVAGQAAETISNLVAALRAQQKDTN